jgi:hypothetical protein
LARGLAEPVQAVAMAHNRLKSRLGVPMGHTAPLPVTPTPILILTPHGLMASWSHHSPFTLVPITCTVMFLMTSVISSLQVRMGPQMPLTHKRVGVHASTRLHLRADGRRGWGRRQAQLHAPPRWRVRGHWGGPRVGVVGCTPRICARGRWGRGATGTGGVARTPRVCVRWNAGSGVHLWACSSQD